MALAARAKLWSTPTEVIEAALDLLGVCASSHLADLGCGAGGALLAAAARGARATGWEVDGGRAASTAAALAAAPAAGRASVIAGNALEADLAAAGVSHVFLYLIERGLRAVLPQLRAAAAANPALRVVTVQYRVPGLTPTRVARATLAARPEVLYLLHLYDAAALCGAPPAPPAASSDA
jgi:precorrin-6B methylase 2